MRKSNSFINEIGNAISFVFFLKYGIPIIIIILGCLLTAQFLFGNTENKKYENNNNVILSSKIDKSVYAEVNNLYDQNVFDRVELGKTDPNVPLPYAGIINYYFQSDTKNIEEYNSYIKLEVTKLFNTLKTKKIKKDQLFADISSESIELVFYYPYNNDNIMLCNVILKYYEETGFDEETYNNIINTTLVTEEKLNIIKK